MYLKAKNDIENNIFSTTVTVDSFGSELMSEDEEKELLSNFPTKIAYRNLIFSKNIKLNGTVPEITDEEVDGTTIVAVNLPALSNKEILLDKDFVANYKIDIAKISNTSVDKNVLTTKELVGQAYCLIFQTVICDAVKETMDKVREKAPSFEGEIIVAV